MSLVKRKDINIINIEYFIDTDPGAGNGIALTAADGSFDTAIDSVNFQLNTSSLGLGAHWIYVRFKDDNDNWGNPRAMMFTIGSNTSTQATISQAEYFIDTDPGEGKGTSISAKDGSLAFKSISKTKNPQLDKKRLKKYKLNK